VLDTVCSPDSPKAHSDDPSIALNSTLIILHDYNFGSYLDPCAKVVQYFLRIADCQHGEPGPGSSHPNNMRTPKDETVEPPTKATIARFLDV
jgi:hypothetical protein